MPRVDRRHEQRAGLPLEDTRPGVALPPDFGAAASLDHQEELVVHVPLGIEGTRRWDLNHVHALLTLDAAQVQEAAAPAQPLPGTQIELARVVDADATEDRDAFLFHIELVRTLDAFIAEVSRGLAVAAWFTEFEFCHRSRLLPSTLDRMAAPRGMLGPRPRSIQNGRGRARLR